MVRVKKAISERNFFNSRSYRRYGSGKVGHIPATVTPAAIEAAFGPSQGASPDGKATMQWYLLMDTGVVASIYDYKDVRWSIGGPAFGTDQDREIVEAVSRVLGVEAVVSKW